MEDQNKAKAPSESETSSKAKSGELESIASTASNATKEKKSASKPIESRPASLAQSAGAQGSETYASIARTKTKPQILEKRAEKGNDEISKPVGDAFSYVHPSFSGSSPPTVAAVARAKSDLINIICASKEYRDAIMRIAINPTNSYQIPIFCADHASSTLLSDGIAAYTLLDYETVWPELLERVYASIGRIGVERGNIVLFRYPERILLYLLWNR
jgi:hypothetical protein